LSSQSLTTASQQSPVADAVAAGAAAALETPAARSATETTSAAAADLVQVRLARIVVLVPSVEPQRAARAVGGIVKQSSRRGCSHG
jgi:hypothetical protein